MHEMPTFTGIPAPTGKSMFAWDGFFYVGMPTLIVRMGKILLFAWGAYFHSGIPIFTVKMGTRIPILT